MFKRLMILGIAGLTFVLGANYLLVYTLNQQVTQERERQDSNSGSLRSRAKECSAGCWSYVPGGQSGNEGHFRAQKSCWGWAGEQLRDASKEVDPVTRMKSQDPESLNSYQQGRDERD